jgi:hypothetical protein
MTGTAGGEAENQGGWYSFGDLQDPRLGHLTEGPGATGAAHAFTDEENGLIAEHTRELERWASGQRILGRTLGIGLVVGLAAHVG